MRKLIKDSVGGEPMRELLDRDASTLAEKIRAGEITSAEAVEGYIRHIERVNPYIRAVVETRFDEARREAEERDRLLQEGKARSEEHTSELQSRENLVCRLLLE